NRVNDCLRSDSNNLLRIVSKRGNEEPVVCGIKGKMINAPFHIRQGDGSGQHERRSARRWRVFLSTHSYAECHNQSQTETTCFSQFFSPSQTVSNRSQACRRSSPATAAQAMRTGSGTFQRNSTARLTALISMVGKS